VSPSSKKIHFDPFPESFDALLVANGSPTGRRLLRALADRTFCVMALDGGVEALFRCGIAPDHVVGDLDSASQRALQWAMKNGARVHHRPSQDKPDFAKGLDLCRKLGCKRVVAAGVAGERVDHVLGTLHHVFAARGLEITLVTNDLVLFALRGRVRKTLRIPRRHALSWFGFPEAQSCTLSGVRWPFAHRKLSLEGFHSLSNAPAAATIALEQKSGRSVLAVLLQPQDVLSSSSSRP
jgi:thiamine pyrophosphokinase